MEKEIKEKKTNLQPKQRTFKSFIVPIAYMNLDINDYMKLGKNKEIEIYSNLPGNEGSVMVRLTGELDEKNKQEHQQKELLHKENQKKE